MMHSTVNLLALAALLVLLVLSLRWVFGGAPKPRRARNAEVLRGKQRADGTWERSATRSDRR